MNLVVSAENVRGRLLYEKHGFSTFGLYQRQSYYNGSYHDAVYMVRYRGASFV